MLSAYNNIVLIFYFFAILVVVLILFVAAFSRRKKHTRTKPPVLSRDLSNPILSPIPENTWESQGTFNPGVIQDDTGHIHLLYRAIGSDGVSRIGYSSSQDGISFPDRLTYPVFVMQNPNHNIPLSMRRHDPILYPSGGSWGGSEDPRLVRIEGRVYMIFNAFDGWDFSRIAVSSIDEKDFLKKQWKWSRPLLISPAGQVNKNWVLFPEKIGGKFALLHSISPEVQVDYVDRLEDLVHGQHVVKSHFSQKGPRKSWDTWVRGVGSPPLKTAKGWLVLYHAIDQKDPHRYKLGALLLDLKDPRRVIARSPEPLLAPDMWYENDWKPGVVYACGAVIKDSTLFVYYGGGDKYVCVASAPLKEVLRKLRAV